MVLSFEQLAMRVPVGGREREGERKGERERERK
jgi:hypothetical protein